VFEVDWTQRLSMCKSDSTPRHPPVNDFELSEPDLDPEAGSQNGDGDWGRDCPLASKEGDGLNFVVRTRRIRSLRGLRRADETDHRGCREDAREFVATEIYHVGEQLSDDGSRWRGSSAPFGPSAIASKR
jgi:hypothetical protein